MSETATTPMEVVAWTAEGAPRPRAVVLPSDPFDGRVHKTAMFEAAKMFLANQRQGTAKTKTRGFVSGGNQKPWRQKGTGRARQGSTRAPNWPGGGKVFGPVPRDYRTKLPKKVRRLARNSALNARAQEGMLYVVAPLAFDAPKTKRIHEMLAKMGIGEEKVLILTAEHSPNVALSARNIPNVEVLRFGDASTHDVLHANRILIEESALGSLESGAEVSVTLPEKKAKKPRGTGAPGDRGTEKSEAKPSKKKPAAKKAPAKKPAAAAKKAAPKAAAKKPAAKKTSKPAAKKPGKKKKD